MDNDEEEKKIYNESKNKWEEMYKMLVVFAKYEILPNIQIEAMESLKSENKALKEQNKDLRKEIREVYREHRQTTMSNNLHTQSNNVLFNAFQMRILELEKQLREEREKQKPELK